MKNFILKSVSLIILLCGNAAFAASSIDSADYINVPFTQGGETTKTVTLSEFKGKVVLLEFWAPWCKYCQRQMPAVSVLAEKYKDEPNFKVIPVSIDYRGQEPVKAFFAKKGIDNLGTYTDVDSELAKVFYVKTIPSFFLLSKTGEIISSFNGMQSFDDDMIEEHLKK